MYLEQGVIWSVTPEYKIQKKVEGVFETLNIKKSGNIPKYAKVHLIGTFSKLLRKSFILGRPSMKVSNANEGEITMFKTGKIGQR